MCVGGIEKVGMCSPKQKRVSEDGGGGVRFTSVSLLSWGGGLF